MKAIFFQNTRFITISNISNIKIFLFFTKKLTKKVEKTFLNNDIIWYTFYRKFATFSDFEKIQVLFRKKNYLFKNKTKFRTSWDIILF